MGISQNVKMLVEAVAENDMEKAKARAKCVIAADKAQGNAGWRERMLRKLDVQQPTMIVMPASIQGLLEMEDLFEYPAARYALLPAEREVFDRVMRQVAVCGRLGEMGVRYQNTTILIGESGCGKTEFARFTAHKLGVPFAYLNFARAIDSYMGATSKNIHQVFEHVNKVPCLFMMDEIDTIAGLRGRGHDGASKELSRVTVTIMQQIDKLPNETVVMAATNLPECVDPALMRRFQVRHEVLRPQTASDAAKVATTFLDDLPVMYDPSDVYAWVSGFGGAMPTQAMIIDAVKEALAASVCTGDASDVPMVKMCQNGVNAASPAALRPACETPGEKQGVPGFDLGA